MNRSRNILKNDQNIAVALALIVFPILVAVAFYASRKLLPEVTNLQFSTQTATESTHSLPRTISVPNFLNVTERPQFLNLSLPRLPMLTYADLLIIIATIVVLYVCLQTFRVFSNRLHIRSISDIDMLEEDRQKVAGILDETARKLALGSDYRDTVLKCYKSILKMLEVKSTLESKALTPSEFREILSRKLRFDSQSFSKVTSLFEVARYSENEITQENAEEAIKSLSSLSQELASRDLISTS